METLRVVTLVIAIVASAYISYSSRDKSLPANRNLNRVSIWKRCLEAYGINEACKLMPKTYVFPEDADKFEREYTPTKEYILKELASGQRKGIFLLDHMAQPNLNNIAVIQEYIPNPMLIRGFKFDTRVFLVIDCERGVLMFDKCYNVYTEKPFSYRSQERSRKINQAMTDDSHYTINALPRTLDELREFGINTELIRQVIAEKTSKVISACMPMCRVRENRAAIYGLDVEILDNSDVRIIEINSLPQITFDVEWKKSITDELRESRHNRVYNPSQWRRIALPSTM
jgi:hypothetical protein